VGRKDILTAHRRFFGSAGDGLLKTAAYLNKNYDSYVHGAYFTAMELYHGGTRSFMLAGDESPHHRCVAKVAVAGKLHEVISALELMALTLNLTELRESIREGRIALDASDEQSTYLPGL